MHLLELLFDFSANQKEVLLGGLVTILVIAAITFAFVYFNKRNKKNKQNLK